MDSRPDCIYGILVRDGRVFLAQHGSAWGLPGGAFRPLAEDRKVELAQYLHEQLGIEARAIWAQGAFDYQHPAESGRRFSGFYSVWEWDGDIPTSAGGWFDMADVASLDLSPSLRILLTSILDMKAMKTR